MSSLARALALGVLLALALPGQAQTPALVGITAVTVSWSAPTSYEPIPGVVTAAALGTAPAGTLTDGTYALYLAPDPSGQAYGLNVNVTVSGGIVTEVDVLDGGMGYAPGDTEVLPFGQITGATANGTLQVTAVTTQAAVPLPATDIDHYTVWWAPADGPGYCYAANCVRGPYGIAFAAAGVTSYTIPAACGDLAIQVGVSTNATAYAPFAMSISPVITESTGVTCPVLGAPGTPKLSWPKA